MKETIGFIGLGGMGLAMATNLVKAGFCLSVYNRTAEKARPLLDLGARLVRSPAEAVSPGGVVVTMVSNDQVFHANPLRLFRLPGLRRTDRVRALPTGWGEAVAHPQRLRFDPRRGGGGIGPHAAGQLDPRAADGDGGQGPRGRRLGWLCPRGVGKRGTGGG